MNTLNWALQEKDLLFMHEKVKCSEEGSGPATVPSEDGQGLNKSGGSTAEPCLEQNQSTCSRIGSETGPESGLRTSSEIGSRIGPGVYTLGGNQGLHQSGGITAKPCLE